MKYGRGRIIALTILSVTMMLALFTGSILFHLGNRQFNVAADDTIPNYKTIPPFDDLYTRVPFDETDTGSITLGQGTKFTILEQSYARGILSGFIKANADSHNGSFNSTNIQSKMREGYPYPVFTNSEMRSIANGMGDSLDIPVIMLDPYDTDDIVLFELTNLIEMPTELKISRDGTILGTNFLFKIDDNITADKVYAGVPSTKDIDGVEYTTYEIGAVAYNANALRGMFNEEGVYEISFKQKIPTGDGIKTPIDISFAFAIVNKINYKNNFPRFSTNNR
ncbi:MAG: hypothetical protein J5598_00125, partial [Clostridia bacterium]|nr:hypothetical protein [Clostridia bacterium]